MSLKIRGRIWGLSGVVCSGVIGCGTPDGSELEETLATEAEALTLPLAGVVSTSPQRGTALLGRSVPVAPGALPRATSFTAPIVNQPGMTTTSPPPDPIGDVGPNHYVQGLNGFGGGIFTMYTKFGVPVSAAHTNLVLSQLVTTTGPCASGLGDPVVNFDQLANRWILSQLASQHLCIYLSDTDDPTALDRWSLYDFDLSAMLDAAGNPAPGQIPDYPKLGVWGDAYYMTANDFAIRANEAAVYALDRTAMLAGATASAQRFVVPNIGIDSGYQPMGVVDLDGKRLPPAGTPGMVVRRVDDEFFTVPGSTPGSDTIEIWNVVPDFTTPANSTLVGPTTITSADTDAFLCARTLRTFDANDFNACAEQPGTPQLLSVLGVFVGAMWRVQYRNFGTFETLVGNFDADAGTQQPATHWFELRRPSGGAWVVQQEQTFAPDTTHRWMASTAMDGAGNLATGYSASSTTLFPSIRYAGRLSTDPLGTLTSGEATMAAGLQSQTGSVRWGDYSSLNVDPVDDCTFWYTSMYYASATAGNTRSTRIGAFSYPFPQCFPASGQCIRATESLLLRDRAIVNSGAQSIGAVANSGSGLTELGTDTNIGDLLSRAPVFLRDRARVNGIVRSQGSVTLGNQVVVTGGITQNTSIVFPPPVDISGVVFPPAGGNITVNPDQTLSRAPGSYGQTTVYSRGRLRLTAGRYFFTSLDLEPQAVLEVDESAGPVTIFVRDSVIFRGSILTPANALASVFVGYTGTNAVFLEAPFNGTFVAPNASLTIGTNGVLTYRAQFVARVFEQRPGTVVTCDTSAQADL
jgi:hypothetical protein